MLIFTVTGEPRPQGSKRAFWAKKAGKAFMIDTNDKTLRPWRQECSAVAMEAMKAEPDFEKIPHGVPVCVQIEFGFKRPQDRKYRNVIYKPVRPDLDKLARGILDALTGICFDDDSQVAVLMLTKIFTEIPGAKIGVAACDAVGTLPTLPTPPGQGILFEFGEA